MSDDEEDFDWNLSIDQIPFEQQHQAQDKQFHQQQSFEPVPFQPDTSGQSSFKNEIKNKQKQHLIDEREKIGAAKRPRSSTSASRAQKGACNGTTTTQNGVNQKRKKRKSTNVKKNNHQQLLAKSFSPPAKEGHNGIISQEDNIAQHKEEIDWSHYDSTGKSKDSNGNDNLKHIHSNATNQPQLYDIHNNPSAGNCSGVAVGSASIPIPQGLLPPQQRLQYHQAQQTASNTTGQQDQQLQSFPPSHYPQNNMASYHSQHQNAVGANNNYDTNQNSLQQWPQQGDGAPDVQNNKSNPFVAPDSLRGNNPRISQPPQQWINHTNAPKPDENIPSADSLVNQHGAHGNLHLQQQHLGGGINQRGTNQMIYMPQFLPQGNAMGGADGSNGQTPAPIPILPGQELTLTDDDGNINRFRIHYAPVTMRREDAEKYIKQMSGGGLGGGEAGG